MEFRFVSLGGDCQTAMQIKLMTSKHVTGFFDSIGSPISTVISLIETGFVDPLPMARLEPVHVGGRLERVIDRGTGLQFVHDFPDFEPGTIAAIQARYRLQARWLMQSFDADEPPSYFIRRWSEFDGPEDERQAMRLFDVLRARRPDIRLLYLHQDRTRPPRNFGAYRSTYLSPTVSGNWVGDIAEWRALLHGFAMLPGGDQGFPLRAPKRPRFETIRSPNPAGNSLGGAHG